MNTYITRQVALITYSFSGLPIMFVRLVAATTYWPNPYCTHTPLQAVINPESSGKIEAFGLHGNIFARKSMATILIGRFVRTLFR